MPLIPAFVRRMFGKALNAVSSRSGWFPVIRESFAGAWQKNIEISFDSVLSHHTVFASQTLIASDIAKLRIKLVQRDSDGVWLEVPVYDKSYGVLLKPNHYQTRIQFFESWLLSKLAHGNAYMLKQREGAKVVALYVLDPTRCKPLVSDTSAVFYELQADSISGIADTVIVPASEIIHDRFNCLFHPLVGISPIFAAGLAATQGLNIQKNATKFFENAAMPGGVLTAPGNIDDKDVERIRDMWEQKFGGVNRGRLAVLGSGMTFERMVMTSVESQMVEQLKLSGEVICSTYHMPAYKVGIGAPPAYNNIQALNVEYYSQCLQRHIEDIELLLDEGLGLRGEVGDGANLGTEFDIDGLLRMDSASLFDVLDKARNVMTLDERRKRIDMPQLAVGGKSVYMQEQDHSHEAIAARDALMIEQAKNPPAPANNETSDELSADEGALAFEVAVRKELGLALH